jgi:hypothetical protein
MKANIHFWSYLAKFFLQWEMFQSKVVEEMKTHILCPVSFIPSENRAVYEMWKHGVERGWPQMTIWRMRIACWIPKATHPHSEYVILIAFPQQRWLQERASTLSLYVHCQSFIIILLFGHSAHTWPCAYPISQPKISKPNTCICIFCHYRSPHIPLQ